MDLDFNLKVGLRHPKRSWLCIESKKAEENKYIKGIVLLFEIKKVYFYSIPRGINKYH